MAGGGIELALHQGRHQVHDGDVHALRLQAGGGLEAEQAAADDHGAAARLAASSMASTSSRSRKVTTPGRSWPGTGMMIGIGAGGDDQLVVGT